MLSYNLHTQKSSTISLKHHTLKLNFTKLRTLMNVQSSTVIHFFLAYKVLASTIMSVRNFLEPKVKSLARESCMSHLKITYRDLNSVDGSLHQNDT